MSRRVLIPIVLTLGLGACATVPQQLVGTYAAVTPEQARGNQAQGTDTRVRWGGRIIDTQPREAETCFFVLNQPLDSQARPEQDEQSSGRFVACKAGFYDPEVYAKGRDLTVTGALDGSLTSKIGEYDYNYPRIAADTVYLWPKRPKYVAQPYPFYDPFYDPFWGPWGFGPWYYPTQVIVVPAPKPPPPPPAKSGHH